MTDHEFWVLLSLDAEVPLPEVLMPLVMERAGTSEQIRPALDVPPASAALAAIVARGYAEVRALGDDRDWETGRVLQIDEVGRVLSDPATWSASYDTAIYWAAATNDGEAAYARYAGTE
jgi:hypothetical protein